MRERPDPAELAEILTHGHWVRRLARRLLDDPSLVDDVVQETWMVAMARRPHGGERLRGWLGSVVHNVVRQTRRADGRRRRREQRAALPEARETSRDLVAEADLHARVTRAVLGLAEPYRSTLLMRYFEELSPEQIAQREGCAESTVRNRQRRALQMLRDGLDGEFDGDRRAWSQALVPLALAGMGKPSSAWVAAAQTPWKEALIMTTTKKVAAAVLVVALTGATWWALPVGGGVSEGEPAVVNATLPEGTDGAPTGDAVGEALPLTAAETPDASDVPADDTLPTEANPGDPVSFNGRVLDPSGQPIVGARVAYLPDLHTLVDWGVPLYEQSGHLHELDLLSVQTDADGRYVLHATHVTAPFSERRQARIMNPLSYPELIVSGDGLAWTSHVLHGFVGGDIDVPDIIVVTGGLVSGRVVDTHGEPIPNVDVRNISLMREANETSDDVGQKGHASSFLRTTSDEDGRWQIPGTSEGSAWIRLAHPDYLPSSGGGVMIADREVLDLGDMVLDIGGTIAGRVSDRHGQPVEGARVFAGTIDLAHYERGTDTILWEIASKGGFLTDARGAFEIRALEGGTQTVWVDPPGHEPVRVEGLRLGLRDVLVEVEPWAELLVAVLDSQTGQPVGSPVLAATRGTGVSGQDPPQLVVQDLGWDATDGRFLVERAGHVSTQLTASAPGYASAHVDAQGLAAGATGRHVIRLVRESVLGGQVLGPDGTTISGAIVSLIHASVGEVVTESDADEPEAETVTTDEDGRFEFASLAAGSFSLAARAPGFADAVEQTVELPASSRRDDLALELLPTGFLRGVVYGIDGRLAQGQGVGIWRGSRSNSELAASTMTDREGRFVFDFLAAGAYRVNVYPSIKLDVVIAVGETTELELFMKARPRFAGRVIDPRTGDGVAGAQVVVGSFYTRDNVKFWATGNAVTTDDDGHYVLVEGSVGPHELVASIWIGGGPSPPVAIDADWGDALEIDIPLGTGRIRGRVVTENGTMPEKAWVSTTSTRGRGGVSCKPDGTFVLDHLAPGTHKIAWSAKGSSTPKPMEITLAAGETRDDMVLTLGTGATLECTVRLPNGEPVADETDVHLIRGKNIYANWERTKVGKVTFRGLAPGRYELVVGHLGNAEFFDDDVFVRWREPLTLAAGEHRSLEVTVDH